MDAAKFSETSANKHTTTLCHRPRTEYGIHIQEIYIRKWQVDLGSKTFTSKLCRPISEKYIGYIYIIKIRTC